VQTADAPVEPGDGKRAIQLGQGGRPALEQARQQPPGSRVPVTGLRIAVDRPAREGEPGSGRLVLCPALETIETRDPPGANIKRRLPIVQDPGLPVGTCQQPIPAVGQSTSGPE
jgi:hypothetical protein